MSSPQQQLPPELAIVLQRLDDLVDTFDQHPDFGVQERVVELLQCVDRLHRVGLRRIAEFLRLAGLEQAALNNPEIRLLFQLYDLHEDGERARIEAVLDHIRPDVEAAGFGLRLVDVQTGVVTVRLEEEIGPACPSASSTVHRLIEQTLRGGLPDFVRIEIQESRPRPSSGFVPLSHLTAAPRRKEI